MAKVRHDLDRRQHLGLEGELNKRGRNKGLFGWFRGRPWACRHITLESTYVKSTLTTWRGDEKRDTIDIVGCTARQCPPEAVNGREGCIEIKLAWGEIFIVQALGMNDAEVAEIRDQWIDALNVAGRPITSVDPDAEKLKIQNLSSGHETCVYEYLKFKINYSQSFEEILRIAGPEAQQTEQRDSLTLSGRQIHTARQQADLLKDVDKWVEYLEKAHPLLYRSQSEQADIEIFHKAELERTMAMHENEKSETLASHGDETMITNRYMMKVLVDKVNYIVAKEGRFMEQVSDMVEQYIAH